jgi:hypothetical protein
MLERQRLEQALELLGGVLAERGANIGVLVVGGSSLLLLGVVERPTADVDVVGYAVPAGYVRADSLPAVLAEAVRDVGQTLGLGAAWFNTGPAGLIDFGLPEGLADRVVVHSYGGLEVHLPAHRDLVCFKLDAAVDQGERSKHYSDLVALDPTNEELLLAARWTRTQDPSPGYLGELLRILALLGLDASHADL